VLSVVGAKLSDQAGEAGGLEAELQAVREDVDALERSCAPAMTEHAPFLPSMPPVAGKKVHVAFDGGRLTFFRKE
jgi:hypothetical protein